MEDFSTNAQLPSTFEFMLDYENYLRERRECLNKKLIFHYNNHKLALTHKQVEILKLVAKGFSNSRIAKTLSIKESNVKLLIYRLMKYLENTLFESVDRFHLVIIAQELDPNNC